MSECSVVDEVAPAVALMAARDGLLALDLAGLSLDQLLELTRRVEVDRRRAEAFDHGLIAHLIERGVAGDLCLANTQSVLVGLLRLSPADAARRVRAATQLGPRRAITGEPLPALFSHVAAAAGEGVLSGEHASVITRAINALPDRVRDEYGQAAEKTLTNQARDYHPAQLACIAARLGATLDPDGVAPREEETRRRRDVTIRATTDASGAAWITGYLTPDCRALLDAALDGLAQPQHTTLEQDLRSPGQRRHDALAEASRRLLAHGGLPDTGGTAATVLLTMTLTELENPHRVRQHRPRHHRQRSDRARPGS